MYLAIGSEQPRVLPTHFLWSGWFGEGFACWMRQCCCWGLPACSRVLLVLLLLCPKPLGSSAPMHRAELAPGWAAGVLVFGICACTIRAWSRQNFWLVKDLSGEMSLSCAECTEFFCTSRKYSAANSSGYKTNVYDFVISKTLVLSLESSSIRNFAKAAIFFIVAADKVSWKQNHTPELINADLEVPVQGDGLLGRNSNSQHCQRQLVPS